MTLKKAFDGSFYIGASLKSAMFEGEDQATMNMVTEQFDSISPANLLKWSSINPKPGVYNYEPADAYVDFGRKHNMYTVGHVLFWHNQTPRWVFEDDKGMPASRDELLAHMRERVRLLASRYKGRIQAWDVVNESIIDNGELRDSPWARIVGGDFIEKAFRIASEELPPDVDLIYNDFSMTGKAKRDAVVRLVKDLKKKGIRIDGVGMQGHWAINGPKVEDIEASITAFAAAGVAVHITELDIDVLPRKEGMFGDADITHKLQSDPSMDPYKDGLPDGVQKKLADRYADVFRVFMKHRDKIKRVTFWGSTDKYSWLNNWPIKGRTNYPLLFDRDGRPKPAFYSVIAVADKSSAESGKK